MNFEQRLAALQAQDPKAIRHGLIGLEKESLRCGPDGFLATTAHPKALGSALTNRNITTDFAEALLEFVTPAFDDAHRTLSCMRDTHQFVSNRLGDERLWNASMPCIIGDEQQIALAQFGSSNVAKMKTIYRRGLGYRYGRAMQTIAGIHFNYSLPQNFWPLFQTIVRQRGDLQDFRSASYLGLLRNFRRVGWLVLYLFGASPAMCKSFLGGERSALAEFDRDTFFEPYATSLRMSDLGYSNNAQSSLQISLNNLDDYVHDLTAAITTVHPPYEKIGVQVDGTWRQLNANLLQIENEYYSAIRPKQIADTGERPTLALQRAGIAYVEVRLLDIDPFEPVGISEEQMRYMEALVLWCALNESRTLEEASLDEADQNQTLTAHSGRAPALELQRNGKATKLADWAREINEGVSAVAELLDGGDGIYSDACRAQSAKIEDSEATPSARVLRTMREEGNGHFGFVMSRAQEHAAHFAGLPALSDQVQRRFEKEVSDSLQRQLDIEAADNIDFKTYLSNYFS